MENDSQPASVKTSKGVTKANFWMILAILLALALVFVLFIGKSGGVSGNSVVDKSDIGTKAVNFINSDLLRGNGSVTLSSVADKGAFYEVDVNYNGGSVPTYFSKDGNYFFPDIVPLNASTSQNSGSSSGNVNSNTNINIDNSMVIGNSSAKVTIVEFSDFSCPFCGAASGQAADLVSYMKSNDPTWEAPVPGIMRDYVQTGKVQFVYKYDFGHTGGHNASLVGWCLNDQGLFWKFYDAAFAHQSDVEDLNKMKTLAQGLGADMNVLNSCLNSNKYDSRFQIESNQASAAGVTGTPTFFVNGQKIEGAVSYPTIKQIIDSALAKS